jgi:hypothetical protein
METIHFGSCRVDMEGSLLPNFEPLLFFFVDHRLLPFFVVHRHSPMNYLEQRNADPPDWACLAGSFIPSLPLASR